MNLCSEDFLKEHTTLRQLCPFIFISFIDSLGWGVVYPAFELLLVENKTGMLSYVTDLSWRNFYFVFIISIYCLCEFIAAPILGTLSDRYGRKAIILLSLLGTVIGFVVSAIAVFFNNFLLLFFSRIISGITSGNLSVIQATITDHSSSENLAKNLNYITFGNGLGFILGPLIGGILMQANIFGDFAYELPFLVIALLAFIAMFYMGLFQQDRNQKRETGHVSFLKDLGAVAINLKDNKKVFHYLIVLTVFIIVRIMFFTELPVIFYHRFSLEGSMVGWLMTYYAAIFTLGTFAAFPTLSKYYDNVQIIRFSLLTQVLCYLLFIFIPYKIISWLVLAPIAMTVPFVYVALVSIVSNNTAKERQGQIMGIIGSLGALGWWLGPLTAGGLMMGGESWLYFTIVALTLLCWNLMNRLRRESLTESVDLLQR